MAKITPDWNALNLLAFQRRIVRKSDGQIVKVAAPPPYAEVTGKPGGTRIRKDRIRIYPSNPGSDP